MEEVIKISYDTADATQSLNALTNAENNAANAADKLKASGQGAASATENLKSSGNTAATNVSNLGKGLQSTAGRAGFLLGSVNQLGSSLTQLHNPAGQAIQDIGRIAAGALQGFAAFGPWGAAIGGVTAALPTLSRLLSENTTTVNANTTAVQANKDAYDDFGKMVHTAQDRLREMTPQLALNTAQMALSAAQEQQLAQDNQVALAQSRLEAARSVRTGLADENIFRVHNMERELTDAQSHQTALAGIVREAQANLASAQARMNQQEQQEDEAAHQQEIQDAITYWNTIWEQNRSARERILAFNRGADQAETANTAYWNQYDEQQSAQRIAREAQERQHRLQEDEAMNREIEQESQRMQSEATSQANTLVQNNNAHRERQQQESLKSQHEVAQTLGNTMKEVTNTIKSLTSASDSAYEASIKAGESTAVAHARATKAVAETLEQQALIQVPFQIAEALGSYPDMAGVAFHLGSAATYGVVAGVSAGVDAATVVPTSPTSQTNNPSVNSSSSGFGDQGQGSKAPINIYVNGGMSTKREIGKAIKDALPYAGVHI